MWLNVKGVAISAMGIVQNDLEVWKSVESNVSLIWTCTGQVRSRCICLLLYSATTIIMETCAIFTYILAMSHNLMQFVRIVMEIRGKQFW